MKRILSLFAIVLALGVTLPTAAQSQSLFTDDEVSLLAFGNYIDQVDNKWGGGLGFNYFFSRYLGIGASTHWENFEGAFFDNAAGEGYLRLPLGSSPIAPYGIGSAGYSWEYNKWFFGLGGGLEWRFSKDFGIFGDIQWLFKEDGEDNGTFIRFGIRLGM